MFGGRFDARGTPSTRELVISGLLLVMMIFGFFLGPFASQKEARTKTKQRLEVVQKEAEAVQNLIDHIQAEVSSRRRAVRAQQEVDHKLDPRLEQLLQGVRSSEKEIANVVAELSHRRMLVRNQFKGVNIGAQREIEGSAFAPMRLQLEGRYASLIQYLEKFERMPWPMLLTGIELKTTDKGSFLFAQFDLELYLLSERR